MRRRLVVATLALVTSVILTSTGCEESGGLNAPVVATDTPTEIPTNTESHTPTHTPTGIATHTTTATPTEAPTTPPTPTPTNTAADADPVVVDLTDTYRLESGDEITAVASSLPLSVEAHVVGTDGQVAIYPAQLSSDGSRYEIADVPEGPYWLVAEYEPSTQIFTVPNLKVYQLLTSRTVDWGSIYAGRPNVAAISEPTIASVEASGLPVPWQQYDDENGELQDYLNFYSYNADANVLTFPIVGDSNAPLNGATSFDGWSFDWSLWASAQFRPTSVVPAVDSSKGDVLLMTQLIDHVVAKDRPDPDDLWASFHVHTAGPSCTVDPVAMDDGTAVSFHCALAATPIRTLALDLKGSKFADEVRSNVPVSQLASATLSFALDAEPGAPFPIFGHAAPLVSDGFAESSFGPANPECYPDVFGTCDAGACPTGCDDTIELKFPGDLVQSFDYQNPYSAHGQELLSATLIFVAHIPHPVSLAEVSLRGFLLTILPVEDGNGEPLEPLIGLPRNLHVADRTLPLDEPQTGLGSTFAVTWEPPSLGTAASYLVRVRAWSHEDDPEVSAARSAVIASFRTNETSIDVPDGLLTAGEYYSVTVQANSALVPETPNKYATATIASAEVSSGLFSP